MHKCFFDKLMHWQPKSMINKNNGNFFHFFCLYESKYFKQMVQCSKPTREKDKGVRWCSDNQFACKRKIKHDLFGQKSIYFSTLTHIHANTDRNTTSFKRTFVCRLGYTKLSSSNYRKLRFSQCPSQVICLLIIGAICSNTTCTKHSNGMTNVTHKFKSFY